VWSFDLRRRALTRLTTDASTDNNAIWSPDGSRIVFSSNRKGVLDLYQMSATGAGSEDPLLTTGQILNPSDYSRDGQFLLYSSSGDPKTRTDIWALPMRGGGKPFPVVQTSANERQAQFSPDGKWIAYQSDRSGRTEVYVQPFPGPGAQSPMSTNGGVQVRWRSDGKELFYVALDGRLMAVRIQLSADGHTVEAGVPAALFLTRVFEIQGINIRQQYMPSPNGQSFLVDSVSEDPAQPPIRVILNWKPRQ
jgi:Tol biopolymer transport system component